MLDEPTTGLHYSDIIKLINMLDELVEKGNTVLIIEHDVDILSYVDYLIELGPEGGPKGGEIIAIGSPEEIKLNDKSKTAQFLDVNSNKEVVKVAAKKGKSKKSKSKKKKKSKKK